MKITIAGCGNMGMIYARAFLKYDLVKKENLLLIEKSESRKQELIKLDVGRVTTFEDNSICDCDVFIIAVKPQDFKQLAEEIKHIVPADKLIISIMAGITLNTLQASLQCDKIIRAMPNSPAESGMGMTGYTTTPNLTVKENSLAEQILSTTGRSVYFENEELIDAVTALSGSGPAYFFYFVKHMVEAGKQMGMEEHTALMMVKQTMQGSYHLINDAGKSLDELIKTVSSKGGTTEAAFTYLNHENVGKHLEQAILKARNRANELSR